MASKVELSTLSISQLVAVYNQACNGWGGKPVKSFKDKATALDRVEKILGEDHLVVIWDDAGFLDLIPQDAEPKTGSAKGKRGRKTSETDAAMLSKKVVVLVEKNPKRGKSAERFGVYYAVLESSDRTVAHVVDYHAKSWKRAQHQALADVKWDVAHGFVRLED